MKFARERGIFTILSRKQLKDALLTYVPEPYSSNEVSLIFRIESGEQISAIDQPNANGIARDIGSHTSLWIVVSMVSPILKVRTESR